MNELISIRENKGKQVVSARELYLSLGYDSSNYSRWVKSNIIENPYSIEGEDWTPLVTNDEPINQNVNPTKDYAITIVMAKKIAMMSKTEIGNKIRDYFIEVYFCTWDYWGECEEYSLVDSFIEMKTWKNIPDDVLKNCDDMWKAYSLSNFQCKSRKWLIKYLSTLPTVRFDSKINKILKITTN